MCGKFGVDAIDSMKNMMTMSLFFVIADVLDVDAMELEADQELLMSEPLKQILHESVMEMFNGCELDFSKIHSIQDIVIQVLDQEVKPVIH